MFNIPIFIDTQSISQDYIVTKEDMDNLLHEALVTVRKMLAENWDKLAAENLGEVRDTYRKNIVEIDEGKFKGAVVLTGFLPNALEQGSGPFDLKPMFATSSKKKASKGGGWYLDIPFQHGTPNALGAGMASKMPAGVYNAIKKKEANQPLKAQELPKNQQQTTSKTVTMPNSGIKTEYQTKAPQYQGLTKIKDTTTGKTKGYFTFRRVSDKSDPASWIHPGFPTPMNLAQQAVDDLNTERAISDLLDNFLSKFLQR